jgi:hypothetical protein
MPTAPLNKEAQRRPHLFASSTFVNVVRKQITPTNSTIKRLDHIYTQLNHFEYFNIMREKEKKFFGKHNKKGMQNNVTQAVDIVFTTFFN